MVGRGGPFRGGGFSRADGHSPVNLAAVGVHHLAVQPLGQGDGQGRLARGGRADDAD